MELTLGAFTVNGPAARVPLGSVSVRLCVAVVLAVVLMIRLAVTDEPSGATVSVPWVMPLPSPPTAVVPWRFWPLNITGTVVPRRPECGL